MLLELLPAGIAGFLAQMIDGALGMGFGVTSASLLLATSMAPAVVASTVKFAQLGTTLASGASHWGVGNVDRGMMLRLAVPGGIGALVGATVLSSLSLAAAAPLMSALLLGLGVLVLLRFLLGGIPGPAVPGAADGGTPASRRRGLLVPLGLVGGLVDSTGGGGWGPVVSSTLLSTGRTAPRRVIGSVAAAEFVVTVCASIGFVLGLGIGGVPVGLVLALMAGGVLAAPIAARLAGRLPAPLLGILVGSLIITLNLGPVLLTLGLPAPVRVGVQLGAAVICLGLVARTIRMLRRRPRGLGDSPGETAAKPVAVPEPASS
ncbi:sulfite exporter TauE/SafE family protein [Brachybacterium sp. YJGR34]|uniref:sulfite exporter TauE/SafE family protein n=1 Tax=Brachybacterium sp. YJGR34 TaxID=2059911 RepID=UPI001E51EAFC|nr:sulfite exporter TauE/SafE family protein [Brachybacterium sp. YJGR34]